MNPILLKPNSAMGSQVVLDGKVWGTLGVREYHENFDFLLGRVLDAYARLAAQYEVIVIEGAGSVAEMNLKDRDLVNLGLARRLDAPALLVADIDRGGVFASIVGTFALLDDDERRLLRSFAVNRFRGEASLFEDGVRILEDRTGRPCLGVFPMLHGCDIDSEDSVSLEDSAAAAAARAWPSSGCRTFRTSPISSCSRPSPIGSPAPPDAAYECIILPGTKSTIADLSWLRATGLDRWIADQARAGAMILGVCGGYQMLGEAVEDPCAVESPVREAQGLGLLPVRTVLETSKTTRAVEAATPSGIPFAAYEIHMGRTARPAGAEPFAVFPDGATDGIRAGRCAGTYLHGALESPAVLSELLGFDVPALPPKQETYAQLADWFGRHARRFEEFYL